MHLHTLFHGHVKVQVEERKCHCGALIPYDGIFDGIVCASRYHSFWQEVLDDWMFDVCGSDMTIRESFSSWKRKSQAVSIEEVIIQEPLLLQRRIQSDAFSIHLKLV